MLLKYSRKMRNLRKELKIFLRYPKATCLCLAYLFVYILFIVKTSPKQNRTPSHGRGKARFMNTVLLDKTLTFKTKPRSKDIIEQNGEKNDTTKHSEVDQHSNIYRGVECDMSSYFKHGKDICDAALAKEDNFLRSYTNKGKPLQRIDKESIKISARRGDFRKLNFNSIETACHIDNVIKSCDSLRASYMYGKTNTSDEEELFPLAFAMKIHTNANQAHRLLRYIYNKHNIYCVHIDSKADVEIYNEFRIIESCFDNIIVIKDRVRVVYSTIRVVEAELKCMEAVSASNTKWKYYINLTGQEFMLKTNLEIVKILKVLNGTNDIESYRVPFKEYHKFKQRTLIVNDKPNVTRQRKKPFRRNIPIHKGSAYGMFSRELVDFILNDTFVKEFKAWLRDTYAPEELIWPTLQVLPGTPGGRPNSMLPRDKFYISRAVKWRTDSTVTCHGKYVHWICIYGFDDVPWLLSHANIVANKFYENFKPLALFCTENRMYSRLLNGGIGDTFDVTLY